MKYTKTPFTTTQHIDLLKERGLIINSEERLSKYLNTVGYFRLCGYMYHLQSQDGTHKFLEGITSDHILLHYQFDKKLRILIIEYLERIEVALRSMLTNSYSISYGFFWYADRNLYEDFTVYDIINQEITESFDDPQERFLKAYKFKYTSETLPPSNMAMEILTLGKLSRLYKGLKNNTEKTDIANNFNLPSTILSSWLIYLTHVRNICAHHARLWNKKVTYERPTIPSRKKYQFHGDIPDDFNTTIYGIISLIDRLLNAINPQNRFILKFIELIDSYPSINPQLMGLPIDWKENPAWKN